MSSLRLIVPVSLDPDRVTCGFTTRDGGVSAPPFDSLNLGDNTPDDPVCVRENSRILSNHLGVLEDHVALMHQVHSTDVRVVDRGGVSEATDGIFTVKPGLLLGVRTADCVPVLLHDPVRGVIGAVHCGWRPIVSGILKRSIELVRREWGSDPADVRTVLGPSAGVCCYEVGGEIVERFSPESIHEREGRVYADLHGEIIRRLVALGVPCENIEPVSRCTICNPADFFSHRRDASRSGRMMGFIMLTDTVSPERTDH